MRLSQKARDEGWEQHMSVMLPHGKLKQEDLELKTSLGYMVGPRYLCIWHIPAKDRLFSLASRLS